MIKQYKVQIWHLEQDKIFTYFIPWQDACTPGMNQPNRTVAGIRGREACAMELGENYDPAIHKVISVVEQS